MQVCGEECCVEVSLTNPLSTPLRLDKVHAVVVFTPTPASAGSAGPLSGAASLADPPPPQPPPASAAPPSFARTSSLGSMHGGAVSPDLAPVPPLPPHQSSGAAAQQEQQAWVPGMTSVMLAPKSKPTRLLLTGRPQLPGSYTVVAVRASLAGASWVQPLLPGAAQQGGAAAAWAAVNGAVGGGAAMAAWLAGLKGGLPELPPGRGRGAARAAPGPAVAAARALPALPLVRATLHGPETPITSPSECTLCTTRGRPTSVFLLCSVCC